ncbi:MAG: hypothetical protein A2V70_11845 [Planctomycetes bacterium RBG_13_63_9]|nr:MAG: hypothetical protein A2V70_11845 [Planctomycetes bacterium RBG_13_63_9]
MGRASESLLILVNHPAAWFWWMTVGQAACQYRRRSAAGAGSSAKSGLNVSYDNSHRSDNAGRTHCRAAALTENPP